jgi:6-phosphogluconolactonase/glucosamine-6-phosphate isomerase/deaminase
MQIISVPTKDEALRQAAVALVKLLEPRTPILLLLSGGSAFQILDYVNAAILDQRVAIGVLDERYSQDPQVNNFSQLQSTAFAAVAKQRGAHFLDSSVQAGESLENLAHRFEQQLSGWTKAHPEGQIIATMSMGPDGHTAGILPYPVMEDKALFKRLFDDEKQWVVGYDADGKNEHPLRVTVTLPFLRTELDAAVVFIGGEAKRAALGRVKVEEGSTAETPARIYREMRHAIIFTDLVV